MAQYIEEGPEVVSSESLPEVYYSSLGKEVADPVDEGNVQFILLRSRPRWFWLCLVAVFVILAAAVGGGVGGTRASKHDPNPSQASSSPEEPTISSIPAASTAPMTRQGSSAPITPSTPGTASASSTQVSLSPTATSGTAAVECPSANLTTYVPGPGSIFTKICDVDWPAGAASDNGQVQDLDRQVAYTMNVCIDACYEYNLGNHSSSCVGVTYNANLTSAMFYTHANCFLKSAVAAQNSPSGALVESAALRSSWIEIVV